jgi:hypothetical protein
MKIAVVLLTWQRLSRLQFSLKALARQGYKDFDVVISNANLSPKAVSIIDKYAKIYNVQGLRITVRHDGNHDYAFRRFYIGRDLYYQNYEVVMFLDDDVYVPNNYIENCISQYEPMTYKSGFVWLLYGKGRDYYKFRKRVYSNDYPIQYAGTGFSMIDASIFADEGLINNAPDMAIKIEDLWLSYYVSMKPGWQVKYMETPGVSLGGSDSVALWRRVQRDDYNKADFLRLLVSMGWQIPLTLPDELA